MLVVESSWSGPDILLRLMEPEFSRVWPSPRYGMGADTSGRLLRRVNARERLDMVNSDEWDDFNGDSVGMCFALL
jgi:hypothetical protein